MSAAPVAVLLDFGGVLVDVVHRPSGLRETADIVTRLLAERDAERPREDEVERDVVAGWDAYQRWKNAQTNDPHPREMGHVEFWTQLVASRWPKAARAVLASEASSLCERLDVLTKDRPPRPGSLALLQTLRRMGIPAGIVSNALAGAGSRRLVREHGFGPYLSAQIYSDEAGVRKPNPEIFERAATALAVDLRLCWYVGDTYDRDVLGGRRAGVARVILMRSGETAKHGHPPVEPDATVAEPADVARMLDEIMV